VEQVLLALPEHHCAAVIIIISTKNIIKYLSFQYLSHRSNLDPEMPFYLGVDRLKNAKSWYNLYHNFALFNRFNPKSIRTNH
jgi:uncharacterized protein YfbU (UPF0304 family)